MSELDDRVPGGPILSAYSNELRDRTAQRYNDSTARDVSRPFPGDGEHAWLEQEEQLTVYDGDDWRAYLDETGGTLLGTLDGAGVGSIENMGKLGVGIGDFFELGDPATGPGATLEMQAGHMAIGVAGVGGVTQEMVRLLNEPDPGAPGLEWHDPYSDDTMRRVALTDGFEALMLELFPGGNLGTVKALNYDSGALRELRLQGDIVRLTPTPGERVLIDVAVDDTQNSKTVRNIFFSTIAPTGGQGADGDVWIQHNP